MHSNICLVVNDKCSLQQGILGPQRRLVVYQCSDYPECSIHFTRIERKVATCCSRCSGKIVGLYNITSVFWMDVYMYMHVQLYIIPHLRQHKLISLVNSCRIYSIQPQACTVFQVFFPFFHLFKKVSKEKRAMFYGTKTQSDGRNTEGSFMGPWAPFRYKKSLQLQYKGCRMVNAWTKEAL